MGQIMFLDEKEILDTAIQHHRIGDLSTAEKLYREALELNPENPTGLYLFSLLACQVNQPVIAENYLKKSLSIENNPAYYALMGEILYKKGDFLNAIEYLNSSIIHQPNDPQVYFNLGNCQLNTESEKAVKNYEKAIQLGFKTEFIYHNLGIAYFMCDNYTKAIESYKKALEIKPDFVDSINNMGCIYYNNTGEVENAILQFEKGLKLTAEGSPKYCMISHNLGKAYILTRKNIVKGWEYYENRIKLFDHHKLKLNSQETPKWEGQNLKDKNVLVYNVGGLGDTLLFARYLKPMKEMGANLYCIIQHSLHSVFKFNEIECTLIGAEDISSINFDFQVPFMSLAHAFKATAETIPQKKGFLKADPEKVKLYKEKYFDNDEFKVGIVWESSEDVSKRNITDISPLFKYAKIKGLKIYSLQKGPGEKKLENLPEGVEIINLGSTFNDFSDTAAAIENLDLLVSVDTSVLHLAGAMKKETWLIINRIADWKWFKDTDKSFWYDSLTVFRNKKDEGWSETLEEIFEKITTNLKK